MRTWRVGWLAAVGIGLTLASPAAAQIIVGANALPEVEVDRSVLDRLGQEPTLPEMLMGRGPAIGPLAIAAPSLPGDLLTLAKPHHSGPIVLHRPRHKEQTHKLAHNRRPRRTAIRRVALHTVHKAPSHVVQAKRHPTPHPVVVIPEQSPATIATTVAVHIPVVQVAKSAEPAKAAVDTIKAAEADKRAIEAAKPADAGKPIAEEAKPAADKPLTEAAKAPADDHPAPAAPAATATLPVALNAPPPPSPPAIPAVTTAPAATQAAAAPAPAAAEPAAATIPTPAPASQEAHAGPAANGEPLSTILFDKDAARLPDAGRNALGQLAVRMTGDEALDVQLLAYAAGDEDHASRARRLSLSRALAVRSYLIDQGVRSTRIEVRALGNKVPEGPTDRVDVIAQRR